MQYWAVLTLLNTILGAGIVALPYAWAQGGFALAWILFIATAVATCYTMELLIGLADALFRRGDIEVVSYELLAHRVLGAWGRWAVITAQLLFAMGVSVGYFLIIREELPMALVQMAVLPTPLRPASQISVLFIIAFFITLPLAGMRTVRRLTWVSWGSLFVAILLTAVVGYELAFDKARACTEPRGAVGPKPDQPEHPLLPPQQQRLHPPPALAPLFTSTQWGSGFRSGDGPGANRTPLGVSARAGAYAVDGRDTAVPRVGAAVDTVAEERAHAFYGSGDAAAKASATVAAPPAGGPDAIETDAAPRCTDPAWDSFADVNMLGAYGIILLAKCSHDTVFQVYRSMGVHGNPVAWARVCRAAVVLDSVVTATCAMLAYALFGSAVQSDFLTSFGTASGHAASVAVVIGRLAFGMLIVLAVPVHMMAAREALQLLLVDACAAWRERRAGARAVRGGLCGDGDDDEEGGDSHNAARRGAGSANGTDVTRSHPGYIAHSRTLRSAMSGGFSSVAGGAGGGGCEDGLPPSPLLSSTMQTSQTHSPPPVGVGGVVGTPGRQQQAHHTHGQHPPAAVGSLGGVSTAVTPTAGLTGGGGCGYLRGGGGSSYFTNPGGGGGGGIGGLLGSEAASDRMQITYFDDYPRGSLGCSPGGSSNIASSRRPDDVGSCRSQSHRAGDRMWSAGVDGRSLPTDTPCSRRTQDAPFDPTLHAGAGGGGDAAGHTGSSEEAPASVASSEREHTPRVLHYGTTLFVFGVTLALGATAPTLGGVLSIVGGVTGATMAFCLPGLIALAAPEACGLDVPGGRVAAGVTLGFGVVCVVVTVVAACAARG